MKRKQQVVNDIDISIMKYTYECEQQGKPTNLAEMARRSNVAQSTACSHVRRLSAMGLMRNGGGHGNYHVTQRARALYL